MPTSQREWNEYIRDVVTVEVGGLEITGTRSAVAGYCILEQGSVPFYWPELLDCLGLRNG